MDTIGIIVPFCSIYPDQKEIRKGIENLKIGFNVKFRKNLEQLYYSVGIPEQKTGD